MYICKCGKIFTKPNNFNGHKSHCKIHLGEVKYQKRVKQRKLAAKKANLIMQNRRKNQKEQDLNNWYKAKHICEYCNKILTIKYGSGRFCNSTCARSFSSSHNINFQKSDQYYRKLAFSVFPHKCSVCNWDEDERILQVHHKDENRKNNNIQNLIILCPTCHFKLTLHLYELIEHNNSFSLKKIK